MSELGNIQSRASLASSVNLEMPNENREVSSASVRGTSFAAHNGSPPPVQPKPVFQNSSKALLAKFQPMQPGDNDAPPPRIQVSSTAPKITPPMTRQSESSEALQQRMNNFIDNDILEVDDLASFRSSTGRESYTSVATNASRDTVRMNAAPGVVDGDFMDELVPEDFEMPVSPKRSDVQRADALVDAHKLTDRAQEHNNDYDWMAKPKGAEEAFDFNKEQKFFSKIDRELKDSEATRLENSLANKFRRVKIDPEKVADYMKDKQIQKLPMGNIFSAMQLINKLKM